VVATTRNDNHGGNLTRRTQHFVNGFVAQCCRHHLFAELILVEWNPPSDRRPLIEELSWPAESGSCEIRIVTVPRAIHARFAHADKLPLFQMIAKNVGIRRSRGEFVLATNIDILFSDEIIRFMLDRLTPGNLYRADRRDIPENVPESASFDEILDFCRREHFRINANSYTAVRSATRWSRIELIKVWAPSKVRYIARLLIELITVRAPSKVRYIARLLIELITVRAPSRLRSYFKWFTDPGSVGNRQISFKGELLRGLGIRLSSILRRAPTAIAHARKLLLEPLLHTNACGDFTLLARADWFALRGYPEWHIFSWHVDSVFLYQANRSGIMEKYVGRGARIFHIEHETGSGFTPNGAQKLFARISAHGLPYITDDEFVKLVAEMDERKHAGEPVIYNTENWGLADVDLPEVALHSKGPPRTMPN